MCKFVEKIKQKIENLYDKYSFMFIITILLGLITHAFVLTNKLVNHDELSATFSKGATFVSGRWGLEYIKYIFPNFSMPWYNGILMIILIAFAACFVIKILNVKSKLKQAIIGGIMITFPTITSTLTYMFTSSSYGLAILLSVICVYFATKTDKKINIFLSITCLVLSLGLYQAYISFTTTLFVIVLIQKCMDKNLKFKEIIMEAIKFVVILIISLALYMIITKICNMISGISLGTYQGTNEMGHVTLVSIVKGIIYSYQTLLLAVIKTWNGITIGKILKLFYLIILTINGIYILLNYNEVRKESIKKGLLFLGLCLILPVAMNMLYILNANVDMHSLMVYGMCMIFILPVILCDNILLKKSIKTIQKSVYIILIIVIFQYITLANECYLKLQLAYENNYAFYSTLVTRIESTPGFDKNSKVTFIGGYKGEMLNDMNEYFGHLDYLVGVNSNLDLISAYTNQNFINLYIGIELPYASDEERSNIANLEELKEMNVYPYDGSIKKIGDIIVVKFS